MTYETLIIQFMDRRMKECFTSTEVDVYFFILHCWFQAKVNPICFPIDWACTTLGLSKPTVIDCIHKLCAKNLVVKEKDEKNHKKISYYIVGAETTCEDEGLRRQKMEETRVSKIILLTQGETERDSKIILLTQTKNTPIIDNSYPDNDFKGLTSADNPRAHTRSRKSGIFKDDLQDIQKKKLTSQNDKEDFVILVPSCKSDDTPPIAVITDAEYTIVEDTDVLEPAPDKPKPPPSERGVAFARWFRTLLPERYQKQIYDEDSWARTFDKLRNLDGYEELEIARVCKWARTNKIWSTNFYSPHKLRTKQPSSKLTYYQVFLEQSQKGNNAQQPTIDEAGARRQARLAKYAASEEDENPENH